MKHELPSTFRSALLYCNGFKPMSVFINEPTDWEIDLNNQLKEITQKKPPVSLSRVQAISKLALENEKVRLFILLNYLCYSFISAIKKLLALSKNLLQILHPNIDFQDCI